MSKALEIGIHKNRGDKPHKVEFVEAIVETNKKLVKDVYNNKKIIINGTKIRRLIISRKKIPTNLMQKKNPNTLSRNSSI